MRVNRKVKIAGKWVMAAVELDRAGRPDAKHVVFKGEKIAVAGGTFYIAAGAGTKRTHVACGNDPESVRRALKTQAHVLELRRRGMEVADAQEIVDSRRADGDTLREVAEQFQAEPPAGFTVKTRKKYHNALSTFAEWATAAGTGRVQQVDKKTIGRWILHLQGSGLDAGTIVPKVRIVLAELKHRGNTIVLDERTLPAVVERERDIYTAAELQALFSACDLEEYELFQVFLLTGMREREVAYLGWADLDAERRLLRVSRKRELGFAPKAYHERTIPVPASLVTLLEKRAERLVADGAGLIFATSREFFYDKKHGGRPDKKMLQKLKQIARRAGLSCGHCNSTYRSKPANCRTAPICRRWGLHKFRHTFATMMLRDGIDIVTVSRWLGHKDLTTTRIYLRALDAEAAQPQVEQSTLAKRFAAATNKQPGKARRASRESM